ncbi:MAG TPA: class I adenylate-forming enzyme family protein [Stellaceae bacterium]|nr:class I adenylate-forming enzyme family protein [Stellaceae bacterium]
MTADYVAYHAAERPDAVAMIHHGRAVSYAGFCGDIRKVARAVSALGVRSGGSVAVGTDDLYAHWLLLLACEQLGIAAASYLSGEGPICTPLLASVDLVLAAPDFPTTGARRCHPLTQPWIQGVLAPPDDGEALPSTKAPDDPVRIVRTSGTTGANKRFLVTRRMHDSVSAQWQWGFALSRRSRYLQTLPLMVRAAYDLGSACLRSGGTVELETRTGAIEAVAAHAITHAILLPAHLKSELDRLPPDFAKPRELTIVSFGAAASRMLRERAIARLATGLCDLYGTVEVGCVSAMWQHDPDGFGALWPQAQAEAVDERGDPVPSGEMGRIRVKTEGMSEAYIGDPETTRRMFRDGWFYPGDAGILRPDRRLKILGRADDLLNIGGQKFLPAVLEDLLVNREVAGDVGVCAIMNADGIDELYIAVSNVAHDDKELMGRIEHAMRPVQIGRFYVVKLDRIPRSPNGKLQREVLKEDVARSLRVR